MQTGSAARSAAGAWWPAIALALIWGVGPALPALWAGEIIGQPFTDLYPSLWGLDWFAQHQPGLPIHADEIGWPTGQGFYFSSPIHGWLACPLLPVLGLAHTYNLLILLSRVASVLLTFGWLRAEGLGRRGALAGAALFGCAPFFHGYAVEGIMEGTNAWTLPLWGWLAARRRVMPASLAFLGVVISSWYLGLAGLLVAGVRLVDRRAAAVSALLGLALAIPFWLLFTGAFPAGGPLEPTVRAAMGTQVTLPRPGVLAGLNPFAKTSYLGWTATALFALGARKRPLLASGCVAAWVLSLGVGPWYHLPGLELVRFPYRLVAASLFLGALIIGPVVDRSRAGYGLAILLALEGWLLAPVEPILPAAPAEIPAAYRQVDPTVLLEVPGPLAFPPGVVNHSRPRARYLLYFQRSHGAASPWSLDFNGLAPQLGPSPLDAWRALDPLWPGATEQMPDPTALIQIGILQVMVHPDLLRRATAEALRAHLLRRGARLVHDDGSYWLFSLATPTG